jgi:hypothetical protein
MKAPASISLLTLAAVSASGCAHTVAVGPSGTARIVLSEYRLRPDRLTAHAGAITFVVRNLGRLTHDLVVAGPHGRIASTPPVPPRGVARVTVTLRAGHYALLSSIQSDEALGERGTLTVTR